MSNQWGDDMNPQEDFAMNARSACIGTGLILDSLHARVWRFVPNPVSDYTFSTIGKIGSGRRSTAVVGEHVFPMVNVGKADHEFTTVEFDYGEFPVHPPGPLDWRQTAAPFFRISSRRIR